MALVGDIPVFSLDPANWSIHFHWPWVSQAAAEGDAEKMMSQYKIGLRNMIRLVHDTAQQTKQHCEYRNESCQSPSLSPQFLTMASSTPRWHLGGSHRVQQLLKHCSCWGIAGVGRAADHKYPSGLLPSGTRNPSVCQEAATKFTGAAGLTPKRS